MKKFFGFGGKKDLPTSPRNKRVEFTSPHGYHIREKDLGWIHKAATVGNVGKVRRILLLGINGLNDADKMNRTPLHLACANGHAKVVALLAKRQCQLNLLDNENRTALIKAVQCQEEECATILLDHGADPNVVDADGNTALHHAVLGHSTAIVEKLLAHKANTKVINKDGLTPLLLVVREKKEHMVEVLVKEAAEDEPLEGTALHLACANGHAKVVALLAKRQCQLNLLDNENRTALIKAVQCQEEECATILLDHGADPNVVDADGNTALHHAVLGHSTAIVEKLLAHKANTKVINKDGLTPLTLAISDNSEDMVTFFIKEAPYMKDLESNHQQTSVCETKSRHESLSESSKRLVDKKSKEDSLSSLSSKRNIDDSWPTSADEDFSFGTKKAMNPHLVKLLADFPRFPKTGEATKPAIEKKENDKMSALRKDEDTDSPWDSESFSASLPQQYVVYLPEAADQKGKNTPNGQVEDSPEKSSFSKAEVEGKDPLPKTAVGMTSAQTSKSDSPESFSSSKYAIDMTVCIPQKIVGTNSVHTSRSGSPEVFPFLQPRVRRKDRFLKNAVGTNSVQTSKSDSSQKDFSSKAAVEVKDPPSKKALRKNSKQTSRSDSPGSFSSSKHAIDMTDHVPQKVGRTNSVHTSRSDSPESFSSSKHAIDVTDPVPQKVVRTNSVHTSRSDSPEVFSFLQPRVKKKCPVLKNAVKTNSVQTSTSESHEKVSSSKAAVEVKDPPPSRALGMTSVQTSKSDSHKKVSSSKVAVEVKDPLPKKAVRTTSVQTSRSDSHKKVSSSKVAVEVKDPLPKKAVRTTSVQTSRSDLEVASGEEEERLDGNENNYPQVSDSYEKGKSLLHEKHMLQAETAKLSLEIDTIQKQNQEMKKKYFEDIAIVKENNDLLQKTIKLNEETFTNTVSQYNGQLNVLTAENTILKSKLESEKQNKERLETEIESYRSRLATAVQDHEQSETSKRDLQRDFQRARDEWAHLRDKMNCDMSDLEDRNEILSQQLSEAESKFNSLEIELHHTREALRERTLVLEGVQRDLSQTQCQKKEVEHTYQKEQDKVNKYIGKQGSLEERLCQLQSENVLLRQQLDDVHNEVYKRKKTVMDFKDQSWDIMKMFQAKCEEYALMLNERNTELINVCNRLKERMHECENSKAEKDVTVRQLQQELAGTLKNQSMSEASLQTTSHSHMNLEDETLDIKKKLDQNRSQEVVSTKPIQKEYEKLRNKNGNLKQEGVNLKRHTLVDMTELSEEEQYHQKAEERVRRVTEAKPEVSRFSQRQAASQENLEKLREIHYALVIRQLKFKSNHLESELSKIKTSHDSKERDLEKYKQLYLKEIKRKESLRNELNKTKERLAKSNTKLLLQKWKNRSLLSIFNPKPGLQTPYDGNFDNFSLNRKPTQRDTLGISISKAWTSPDVMKMRQEFEKKL